MHHHGALNVSKNDHVYHRALRYFFGVHRFATVIALYGDSGWLPSVYKRMITIIRFWNRLLNMPDHRLTKKVFIYDYEKCINNWSSDVKNVLTMLSLNSHFTDLTEINLTDAKEKVRDLYSVKWVHDLHDKDKLRTYRLFKNEFKREDYMSLDLRKYERSLLCQFRFLFLNY